jgi:hypothetical protein
MPAVRHLPWVRWLLAATQILLLAVPLALAGPAMPHCPCGMERGHCICRLLSRARPAGHCGMNGSMPDSCTLRSSKPLEGRTSPLGPDFRDRLGVFRSGGPDLDPAPLGTVASSTVLPVSALSSPPDPPPPRSSFRLG